MHGQIPLRNRRGDVVAHAVVDADDFDWLNQWRWHRNSDGYVVRGVWDRKTKRMRKVSMHRLVLGLSSKDQQEVDHRDRNKLDNRRSNLRVATHAQNSQNRPAVSGLRGATYLPSRAVWQSRVRHKNRTHFLGNFDTEEEAAAAASAFRREIMPFSEEDLCTTRS